MLFFLVGGGGVRIIALVDQKIIIIISALEILLRG